MARNWKQIKVLQVLNAVFYLKVPVILIRVYGLGSPTGQPV